MPDETKQDASAPVVREFEYNGMKLPDPNPALSKEQAVAVLAAQFPEIATAQIKPGPETDGVQTFQIITQAKTKG